MLVLTRKLGDSIQIGENITITVIDVGGQRTRLAISAPKEIPIARSELLLPNTGTPAAAKSSPRLD